MPDVKKTESAFYHCVFGGTINKRVAEDGVCKYESPPGGAQYLTWLNLPCNIKTTVVVQKDSAELNAKDIEDLVRAIDTSPYSLVLVTTGATALDRTAQDVANRLKRRDVLVVFTAAKYPAAGVCMTDAPYKIGGAISFLFNSEKIGVYISTDLLVETIEDFETYTT